MREAHDILGVAADADSLTIRAAYVARLKTAHPDAGGAGTEPVSEIVRAYRSLRSAALRKRLDGIQSRRVAPIAMRNRRGFQPPVPRASRAAFWGRAASLIVLAGAIGATFYVTSRLELQNRPLTVVATGIEASARAEPGPIALEAIDLEILREAVAAARTLASDHGTEGLESHSQRCYRNLDQAPSLRLLDYCLAFDSAATSLMTIAGTAGRTGTEAFFHPGTMSHRHAAAVRRLLPESEWGEARHSEVEARAVTELSMSASD